MIHIIKNCIHYKFFTDSYVQGSKDHPELLYFTPLKCIQDSSLHFSVLRVSLTTFNPAA